MVRITRREKQSEKREALFAVGVDALVYLVKQSVTY